jgi:hypothetical protein
MATNTVNATSRAGCTAAWLGGAATNVGIQHAIEELKRVRVGSAGSAQQTCGQHRRQNNARLHQEGSLIGKTQ